MVKSETAATCVLVSVLAEAPEGVQAAEGVVAVVPPDRVETPSLSRLQEALLGHSLFPSTPSFQGESLRREGGQQVQGGRRRRCSGGGRRRADAWRGLQNRRSRWGEAIEAVGGRRRACGRGEGWAEGGRRLGICRGVLEQLQLTRRVRAR